ncbi:response regulator [Nocardioides sp.]|uniref:PAS domain-containing hybrid sensor histidine kinase/response regulator n=1 Tax=Nocardioides sp. TaxID=35761 RepID=UPI00286B496E|nr:response regulator [Nocardioides sp.]
MAVESVVKVPAVDRRLAVAAAAALSVLVVSVHLVVPTGVVGDGTYLLAIWAASALAWLGTWRAPRSERLVPSLIATGLTLSAIGDLVWLAITWSGTEPDVSIADIPYLASYGGLGAALLVITLIRTRTGDRHVDGDAIIDALTIVVVSILVFWSVSITAIVADTSVSAATRVVWAAYPVADAVLLALVVRALLTPRSRSAIGLSFAVGVACWLASDLGYLLLPVEGFVSGVLDAGWMAGGLLMALAAFRRSTVVVEPVDEEEQDPGRDQWRLSIAIVPLLVPPALEVLSTVRGDGGSPVLLATGMVLLLGLAFVRTSRLLGSERRARDLVRRNRRLYERLTDNSSDAVLVVDAHGAVVRHSPHLARLVGLASVPADLPWTELVDPADLPVLDDLFQEALRAPGRPVNAELRVHPRSGAERWISVRLVDLTADPDVRGIAVSLADISARKLVESELETSRDAALAGSRAKSAFLATMSHEIRTPMNGVIGLTGLLLTTELDERQRQYAEGVRGAGEALLSLINDILDFSKVEAGKLQLETLDFDLVQVVEEAAELVAEPARAQDLELLAYTSPELPGSLRGDPSRIRQVLLNLASNAVKFTAAGEVVIRAQLDDTTAATTEGGVVVRFEVTDTGVGVDPADQDQLFDPFSQADSSTTRKYGGTGLGLAISRQLVAAMGGTIGVDSVPGEGSTFWFTLPLALAHESVGSAPPATELSGQRVLVVDDNQTNRLILGDQLGAWGMHADAVEDGVTALRRLDEARAAGTAYDVVVLDLCMPEMDGLELAALVSAGPAPAPGMVLLTSGSDVTAEEGRRVGIGARLTKPVHLARLATALEEVLSAQRTPRPAAPQARVRPAPGSRGHVLVVEDSFTNQLVAVGILESLGYSTDVAGNGLEALEALERSSFGAVLMDCQMPEMDGYDATREIRRREGATRRTPVIAMTASVTEGERQRCLEAGMDDYLSKPVHPRDVGAMLDRWVPASTPG